MNMALSMVQGLLTFMMLLAGAAKQLRTKEQIAEKAKWAEDFSQGTIRLIGLAELACGLGLLLPWVTGIAPILIHFSAAGACAIMAGATVVHWRRKELGMSIPSLVLALMAAYVVYRTWR